MLIRCLRRIFIAPALERRRANHHPCPRLKGGELWGKLSKYFTVCKTASSANRSPCRLAVPEKIIALLACSIFSTVSGDSDYTPLVGRLKSMGKFVLGISRSEAASTVFINACNEFQFLEGVSGRTVAPAAPKKHRASTEEAADEAELNKLIVSILEESADTDGMYASELKGILLRLRPDFNEKSYGCSSFGKLLTKLSQRFGELRVKNDNFNMMVNLNSAESAEGRPQLTKDNWREAFAAQLQAYKDGGFERVNPSILKADILTSYPDFTERSIGFKRFSDVMKQLEKDGLVVVEMDEQKTMLIKLL